MPAINGIVLTFDTGGCTGYAHGDPDFDAGPVFAHHKFASTGDNYGRHQANAREFFLRTIDMIKPVLIGYEQPSIFKLTTPQTQMKLSSYATTLEEVCLREHLNIPVRQINPSSVKLFWTGNGKAKKPQMVEHAYARGFRVENDDEADAVADWHWMIHCYGSEEQKARFQQASLEVSMGRKQKAIL